MDISTFTTVPYEYIEQQLIIDEGCSLDQYTCPAGFKTVGIGHNIAAQRLKPIIGRELKPKEKLTMGEAILVFNWDLITTLEQLTNRLPYFKGLPQSVQYVLINMSFNMGVPKLGTFHRFLAAVAANDRADMINEMVDSKWYHQVGERSLRLVEIIYSGEL